jgi:phytoene dehydrogenase-like protein
MLDLVVAGAGVAGLVAIAEARRLGAEVLVFEKLDRPGGSSASRTG